MNILQEEIKLRLNFLSQLSSTAKNELYRIGQIRTFAKGDLIFKAGDIDTNVWVITDGRVKISQSSAQGRDILLWFTLSGDIFGLEECLQERTRMVYARAAEITKLISIPHTKFKEWICTYPEITYSLIEIVTVRMRDIGQRFLNLANGNVQLEVAQLLISLCSNYGKFVGTAIHISIPLTVQDIADMAGTSRQGVSSCLSKMKRHGIIDCVHHFFIIKKLNRLKRFVNGDNLKSENSNWINETGKMEQYSRPSSLC